MGFTEESGEVKRAFQCPYHAWTYDLDGKLVAAPDLTSMPDLDRTAYGLVNVHVREWLGYVWVCLADNPPSFEEDVVGVVVERLGDTESIEHYGIENLSVGRRITYGVQANWKLIIENFMECYHCATIHPELTEVLAEFADGYAAQYYVGHGAEFGEEVIVESGKDVDRSVELFHRVNQQDFDACERTQPGMSSRLYAKGGVLVLSEHHIGEFHTWLQDKLGVRHLG